MGCQRRRCLGSGVVAEVTNVLHEACQFSCFGPNPMISVGSPCTLNFRIVSSQALLRLRIRQCLQMLHNSLALKNEATAVDDLGASLC